MLVNFMGIWSVLLQFRIFYGLLVVILVKNFPFWYHTEKNLATLMVVLTFADGEGPEARPSRARRVRAEADQEGQGEEEERDREVGQARVRGGRQESISRISPFRPKIHFGQKTFMLNFWTIYNLAKFGTNLQCYNFEQIYIYI
jgi:hypothetical protein